MHLQYTLDEKGNRIYTLRKKTAAGLLTKSAHPGAPTIPYSLTANPPGILNENAARFSPDDKFSRHRVTIKKRHGVLLTQLPAKPM